MKTTKAESIHWKLLFSGAAALAALLLAGCDPEGDVVWAPDGQHAYVLGSGSNPSVIVDGSGNPIGPILQQDGTNSAESVLGWMPDSRRVIVWRGVKPGSWAEYAGLLGPERAETVALLANGLASLVSSYRGDWSQFQTSPGGKAWQGGFDASGEQLETVIYYLNQTQPSLKPLLNTAWCAITGSNNKAGEAAPDEDQLFPGIWELRIRNAIPPNTNPAADQLTLRSPDEISWAAPSPSGRAVAFVRGEAGIPHLYVTALKWGAQPVSVDIGAQFAAWSPDGQSLAYAKSTTPSRTRNGNLQLGSIACRRVCAASGDVIPEPEPVTELAGVILADSLTHVAWLPDGRILFAGGAFTLPATTGNMPSGVTLFALSPGPNPAVQRLLSDAQQALLPERADLFVVSPDGTKIAIPGKSGAVSLFFLDTGILESLQPEIPKLSDDQASILPSWRSANELSYVVAPGDPAGSPGRAEVVLATVNGGKQAISKTWRDVTFLPRPAPGK